MSPRAGRVRLTATQNNLWADRENSQSSWLSLRPCKRPSSWREVRLVFWVNIHIQKPFFLQAFLIQPTCKVEWWHPLMFARSEPQTDRSMAACLVQIQPTWIQISCSTNLGEVWFILFDLTVWLLYVVRVAQIWSGLHPSAQFQMNVSGEVLIWAATILLS